MTQLRSLVDLDGKEIYLGGPEGFGTIEEAFSCLDGLGVKRRNAVIIRYRKKYYPVLMESFQKEIVIGVDKVWSREDGYFFAEKTDLFTMPYEINRKIKKTLSRGIVEDMLKDDPYLEAYTYSFGEINKDDSFIHINNNYPVLLGLTFKDDFFTTDQVHLLHKYFSNCSIYSEFMKKRGIAAINPFKSLAIKERNLLHFKINDSFILNYYCIYKCYMLFITKHFNSSNDSESSDKYLILFHHYYFAY